MSALAVVTPIPQQEAAPAASTMTLLALSEELVCLLDTADMVEEGSADRAELDAAIAQFQAALPVKVDRVAAMLAHLEAQAKFAAEEIKRLQARKQSFDRAVERLEGYCIRVIEQLPEPKKGARKLEGKYATLSIRPSEGVIFPDESQVPADYKTAAVEMPARAWEQVVQAYPAVLDSLTKQDLKVRAADVKKALKSGLDVPGADIEYRNNLRRS